jgi:hypothetical protein
VQQLQAGGRAGGQAGTNNGTLSDGHLLFGMKNLLASSNARPQVKPQSGSMLTWRPTRARQVSIILIVLVVIILQVTG